jgi:hypothetical protein
MKAPLWVVARRAYTPPTMHLAVAMTAVRIAKVRAPNPVGSRRTRSAASSALQNVRARIAAIAFRVPAEWYARMARAFVLHC